MSGTTEIAQLPPGLWSQPALDTSAVAVLGAVEPVQRVRIPADLVYDFIPGLAPTRFLRGLAEKKIFGERCPETGDVYVPPRGTSPTCGLRTTEQVELSDKGTVASFCVVHIGFGTNAPPTPFCSALVLLDGAVGLAVRADPGDPPRPGAHRDARAGRVGRRRPAHDEFRGHQMVAPDRRTRRARRSVERTHVTMRQGSGR